MRCAYMALEHVWSLLNWNTGSFFFFFFPCESHTWYTGLEAGWEQGVSGATIMASRCACSGYTIARPGAWVALA